jgi:hypothetical protein
VSVEILGEEELLGLEGSTREDLLTLGQGHYRYPSRRVPHLRGFGELLQIVVKLT